MAEASHDPFVALALATTTTSRVRLGTSVALAFARTPMATAYSAYDVHRLSGGRLVLGLGPQIKPHITRRYSMPWSRPAARMAEYVEALRAIFTAWQTGERLDFRGEFYSHTLMPPLFDPGPLGYDAPPVWLAGVGPRMVETAGRVADGFIGHPLVSRSFLQDELLPRLRAGRASSDRAGDLAVTTMAVVAVGRTEEELAEATAAARRQLGFYASTPAYRPVLDHHGWGELHEEAHRATLQGQWDDLAAMVDDEVLDTFAVRGDPVTVRTALTERFGDLVDRVTLSVPHAADPLLPLDVLAQG
ncbi:TIGR03617 family F420-dependent LLM class oxidoreductase [Nocardioides marmoribigeumensis]|uniref:F420-dependent oxidoreductase n=1 Tax=Nocardioides marmoribigeumensis TaxID=433649 RepID=A0ABU2BY24_9ACTN|nr:TIGR03617 family F420-dependent LLM class oxidoreductase [Nocardioides marmoribigeumensis]MDR7363298.1 putative F420-dependent oxidoreductase [Nocardioides marmoribigeumensis]